MSPWFRYHPTVTPDNPLNSPNTLSSHSTTAIMTTTFKILLMGSCIGMYVFTSHSSTPITISTITSSINGIVVSSTHSVLFTERL